MTYQWLFFHHCLILTLISAPAPVFSVDIVKCLKTMRKNVQKQALQQSTMLASTNIISTSTTQIDEELKLANMLPRGSAIVTSSGKLAEQGIRQIIHAATGSMNLNGPKFDPTLQSVADSVQHSLKLAKDHGHQRVAIPFIGGKIFVERIGVSPQTLADKIVETALLNRENLELRFVTFGEEDTQLFKTALAKFAENLSPQQVLVTPGSITDFSLHGASAIVNAANTEVIFGGGLSGAIAKATGEAEKINQEAQKAIKDFYAKIQ